MDGGLDDEHDLSNRKNIVKKEKVLRAIFDY